MPGGKPPIEITEGLCDQAEVLASKGLTQEQIALGLGMGLRTLYEKKAQYPQFSHAIQRGQSKGIAIITNKLFERATGYSLPEEKIFYHNGEIIRAQTTKNYPPDLQAITLYLTNQAGWVKNQVIARRFGKTKNNQITIKIEEKEPKNLSKPVLETNNQDPAPAPSLSPIPDSLLTIRT